jgi:hypothetical protein
MDAFEILPAADSHGIVPDAVCWECGERGECYEYVVCGAGTVFHVCVRCEEKLRSADEPPEADNAPAP